MKEVSIIALLSSAIVATGASLPSESNEHGLLRLRNAKLGSGNDVELRGGAESDEYLHHGHGRFLATPSFQLRMYWFEGVEWQGKPDEQFWCWKCDGSSCNEGDEVELDWCSQSDPRQKFQYINDASRGNAGRFKAKGTNLCMTAMSSRFLRLMPCDLSDVTQLMGGFQLKDKFELTPHGSSRKVNQKRCLSSHHEPRSGEPIYAALCAKARKSETSYWEAYKVSDGKDLWGPECSSSYSCGECEGDCDYDSHCSGDLRCFQRDSYEAVPGFWGSGRKGHDYCYKEPFEDRPGKGGVGGGGKGTGGKSLSYVKECTSSRICGECEGDCDGHNHCVGDLQCFERRGKEAVPGCSGSGLSGKDYCYRAESGKDSSGGPSLKIVSNKDCSKGQCGECEGDCDYSSDCKEGLICFQRSGNRPVPGCSGPGVASKDYCIKDPNYETSNAGKQLKIIEDRDCEYRQCGECEGDCDDHSDCQSGLKCRQRDGTEAVPGCSGKGKLGADYCYKERS